jgi:hypothetical protein
MTRRGKVVLIVLGVIFALMATCIGGALYWWKHNGEALMEAARKSGQEGAAFGTSAADAEACIAEGLRRSSDCGPMDLPCLAGTRAFTQACLGTAPADDTMCQGVPDSDEIMDSVSWVSDQCEARGHGENPGCQNVLSALQDHCAGKNTL